MSYHNSTPIDGSIQYIERADGSILALQYVHRPSLRSQPEFLTPAHISPSAVPFVNTPPDFFDGWKPPQSKTPEYSDYGEVKFYIGGGLVTVKKPLGMPKVHHRGIRGKVYGFSKASRRRLLRKLAALQRAILPLFVTLTYPGEFPLDSLIWKKHFDTWCKRLHRRYPQASLIWRLEPQRRGAPHYHLLLYGVPADLEFGSWLRQSWYEVVGSGDSRHLVHGAHFEVVRSHRGVRSYASKYMAKPQGVVSQVDESTGEVIDLDWNEVGRWWGVRYGENLPWAEVVSAGWLSLKEAARLMRAMRRYASIPGRDMPGLTIFCNSPEQWFHNFTQIIQ